MNPILTIPVPASTGKAQGALDGKATLSKTSVDPADAALFRGQLAQQLTVTSAAKSSAAPAETPSRSLEKKIATLLRAGTSAGDVVTSLAASLASSVAQRLGVTDADAIAHLQAVFASALAPPGHAGPSPGTTEERAKALAQRFTELASVATRIASSGESGQLNRLVGNVLDAKSAKETPAPILTTDANVGTNAPNATGSDPAAVVARVLAQAQSQLSALAVPPTPTSGPGVAAAVSDGRIVQTPQLQAVATGGDTLLGRVLARAANVADARVADAPQTRPTDGSSSAVARASAPVTPAPVAPAVTAFLKSFEAALALPTAKNELAKETALPEGAAALLLPSESSSATAAVPSVSPFAIGHTASAETAPAPPAPAANPTPVDPSAIVDQIMRGTILKNTGESSEIRLQLVPEHLGDVTVKLTVTGSTVDARVIAQTADVRDALVSNQAQLTKSLADAGLKLSSFTVDVSNGGFSGQQQQHGQPRFSAGRRALLDGPEAVEGSDESALLAIPSFGPPLVAGTDPSALNYLV